MASYAEKHGIADARQLAEHMLANADEWLLVVPNDDPALEGEFIVSPVFQSNARYFEVVAKVAREVLDVG